MNEECSENTARSMIIANIGTLDFNEVVDEHMTGIEERKNKKVETDIRFFRSWLPPVAARSKIIPFKEDFYQACEPI